MILDIVLIAIVVICAYFGFKRGFVKSLCNMCSLLISIIIAFLLYNPITEFIADSVVGKFISEKISASLGGNISDMSQIPKFLQEPFEASVDYAANTMAQNISNVIIGVISIVITIIIVKFVIKLLFKALNVFAKLPVIKQCNKLMGTLFGIVSGMFWVCITVLALTYISFIPSMEFIRTAMDTSYVAAMVAQNNFLLAFYPKK